MCAKILRLKFGLSLRLYTVDSISTTTKGHLMKFAPLICLASVVLMTSNAYAGVHCPRYPIAEQLPVRAMSQKAAAAGIQIQKIETDDNCYEIKGIDKASGKIIKNKYDMKTGKLISSKIKSPKQQ